MKLYRQFMQARDKHVKSMQKQWREFTKTEQGQALSTRQLKAGRRVVGLR